MVAARTGITRSCRYLHGLHRGARSGEPDGYGPPASCACRSCRRRARSPVTPLRAEPSSKRSARIETIVSTPDQRVQLGQHSRQPAAVRGPLHPALNGVNPANGPRTATTTSTTPAPSRSSSRTTPCTPTSRRRRRSIRPHARRDGCPVTTEITILPCRVDFENDIARACRRHRCDERVRGISRRPTRRSIAGTNFRQTRVSGLHEPRLDLPAHAHQPEW